VALSSAKVAIHVDPARLRPSDLPVLIGDPTRLRAVTGFAPSGKLDAALADLLADWRLSVERGRKMEARHP
jgi:GDP-4-dehydro-6-deoxy-D-mannose reductase